MESRKTTTITFRIDDSLKQKLSQVAERENKTITVKVKEALTEYLEINPVRGFAREVNSEIQKINIDVEEKMRKWKNSFDSGYINILENQKLLSEYHKSMMEMITDVKNNQSEYHKKAMEHFSKYQDKPVERNSGMGFKLTYFAIAIIFFNFMLTGLLFLVLGN